MTNDDQVVEDHGQEQIFDVRVSFLSTLPKMIGCSENITISVRPGNTILNLLDLLVDKIGGSFIKIKDTIINSDNRTFGDAIVILMNGRNISAYNGLETIIKKGDELTFFIPFGGG
ncbi:MAG: MoaD/ThiS family protein [Candidatus Helarchaeota archaeon]